jgi:hypothetical protein
MNSEQPPKQQPKRVIDWIKFKNLKDNSVNYSAMTGLKRINKILSRFIKFGVLGLFLSLGAIKFYKDYKENFENGIKNFEEKIKALDDKERIYLNKHRQLSIEYANISNFRDAEERTGISYYREKLLKNASGLVLETCCGVFLNKDFYPSSVKNVNL